MNRRIKLIFIVLFTIMFVGCAITPPVQEVSLPSQSISQVFSEDAPKLVIYNDSDKYLYGLDNSGKINIYLDGKGVGRLNIGQYVIVNAKIGKHEIKVMHKEIIKFESVNQVDVEGPLQFIKIYSKATSNGLKKVEKPEAFEEKFKPAY